MSARQKHAPRVPLVIRGGIRAQSGRGLHGRPWWSRRWLEVIEGFRLGARLGRGRSYALSGQVAQLDIAPGSVTATVQGSSERPYTSEIRMRRLDDAGSARVLRALRAHPVLSARLLVRDLPRELEPLFQKAGCPLFPERDNDIVTDCTCPDWANPCKHLAAVYFLLGEALDRDPFLLLTLRGIRRADVAAGEDAADGNSGRSAPAAGQPEPMSAAHAVGPAAGGSFWGAALPPFEDFGPAPKHALAAPLVSRLGPLPFWRGQERFLDAMDAVYTRAAPLGWRVWTAEEKSFQHAVTVPPDEPTVRLRHPRLQMDMLLR